MDVEIDYIPVINETQENCNDIPRISAADLSFNDFFQNFMSKNLPVIITINAEDILTQTSSYWFKNDTINIDKLEDMFKDYEVPIADCSQQYYNSHKKTKMTFSEYANYWRNRHADLLYLKDFHLKHEIPQLDFYNVPQYFASDWFNEFLIDTGKEDYRFVYLGVKDTFTNLHLDVCGSYSWSANVCGEKRWLILPKHEEEKLKDEHGKLPFSTSEEILNEKNVKFFDITQKANEIIFVPSGWFHQVHNSTDVFSINHNWFNGCNIMFIWENLLKNLSDVKREINDCREMENFDEHCQLMLKMIYGLNIFEFVEIITHIVRKRVDKFKHDKEIKMFDEFHIGQNIAIFDIQMAGKVLNEIVLQDFIDDKLKLIINVNLAKIFDN